LNDDMMNDDINQLFLLNLSIYRPNEANICHILEFAPRGSKKHVGILFTFTNVSCYALRPFKIVPWFT